MAKYARFFPTGGEMSWDGVKDEADLRDRLYEQLNGDQRTSVEEFVKNAQPGDFVLIQDWVIVRLRDDA